MVRVGRYSEAYELTCREKDAAVTYHYNDRNNNLTKGYSGRGDVIFMSCKSSNKLHWL